MYYRRCIIDDMPHWKRLQDCKTAGPQDNVLFIMYYRRWCSN